MKFLGGEKVIPSASNAEDDIEVGGGVKHRGDYEYALQKVEEAFVPAAEIEGSRKANVSGTEVYIVGQFETARRLLKMTSRMHHWLGNLASRYGEFVL